MHGPSFVGCTMRWLSPAQRGHLAAHQRPSLADS